MEHSLIIHNSRESIIISISQLLYIKAEGNYSYFFWIDNAPHPAGKPDKTIGTVITIQLGEIDKLIEKLDNDDRKKLVRIGRSLIINLQYLYKIDLTRTELHLMDRAHNIHTLEASHEALSKLKKAIDK